MNKQKFLVSGFLFQVPRAADRTRIISFQSFTKSQLELAFGTQHRALKKIN